MWSGSFNTNILSVKFIIDSPCHCNFFPLLCEQILYDDNETITVWKILRHSSVFFIFMEFVFRLPFFSFFSHSSMLIFPFLVLFSCFVQWELFFMDQKVEKKVFVIPEADFIIWAGISQEVFYNSELHCY